MCRKSVEEKFEKYFGFLARCEGKLWYIDPKIFKILGRDGMKMQTSTLPKFEISIFEEFGFGKSEKSAHQNLEKCKIGTSKFEIRLRIWQLGSRNPFSKIQNRFLQFLSNLVPRPKNLKSPTSKTTKSSFSLQNSYFRLNFFFDQNLDFVLGITMVKNEATGEEEPKEVVRQLEMLFVRGDSIIIISPPSQKKAAA